MSNFNYTEYLRNNPLLKPEVKGEKLITESKLSENVLAQKLRDEATHPDSKVGASILNKYAEKVEKADKKDYVKLLKAMESELISKHPNTFSGEDDIPGSFLSEEITEETPSSKMKVSELKAKIKEDIMSLLQEEVNEESDLEAQLMADLDEEITEAKEDEEEDVEVDVEADVEDEVGDEIGGGDASALDPEAGLTQDEQDIQNALKVAYDNAVALGDEKLSKQIGNTITMFTRTRVVNND